MTEVSPDINGIQILKFCCVVQQQRVDRLLEFERIRGITIMGLRDVRLLAKIARAVIIHQAESAETNGKSPAELTSERQYAKKLDPIDGQLWRQAAAIVIDPIRKMLQASLRETAGIENSNTAPADKDAAAEAFAGAGDNEDSKDIVTEVPPDIDATQTLRLCCARQQQRVRKLLKFEEMVGITVVGYNEVRCLTEIALAVVNLQQKSAKTKWKDDARKLAPRKIPEPGSLAERISKLDAVDWNLMRQAYTMTTDIIREKAAELKVEQGLQERGANRG